MNWGRWIILSFVFFALFVASLVFISVREDINLVTENYYEEEIAYQAQIDRIENTKTLETLPSISIESGYLKINYEDLPKLSSGTIDLFRPSDASLDQKFSITRSESTTLQFRLGTVSAGLYKARFTWEMNSKEYFYERIIIL